MKFFVGVDVGTGSARAGVFTREGRKVASATRDIQTWKYDSAFVEQSSEDIWAAVCHCVKKAVKNGGIDPSQVQGIGFDATCSLVVLDAEGTPLPVNAENASHRNVVVWMDHRAKAEADFINGFPDEEVLRYVGATISLEMQIPKLLWLKKHLPETWHCAAHFFDLPDFLTFRATGDGARSLCSTVCKWTYLGHHGAGNEKGWDRQFFERIGLGDLLDDCARKIGQRIRPMGEPVGTGLSMQAAGELGLTPGTAVGVSIIDAHAGGIGMFGMRLPDETCHDFNSRLALIGGTSSCHMAVSSSPSFIPGIWGPYFSAMLPGLWLNEGGQSATGALVDHIVFHHGATAQLLEQSHEQSLTPYELLNQLLAEKAKGPVDFLTGHLHVNPDFHGNRSPRADPNLLGMISGLRLSSTVEDLAFLYLATVQAIAYGTRHIVGELNRGGYQIRTILACGGGTKNPVFLQAHANVTGCQIVLPEEPESVLVGAAILGAVAGGAYRSIAEAMAGMSRPGKTIEPEPETRDFHDCKYAVFHRLHQDQLAYAELMTIR